MIDLMPALATPAPSLTPAPAPRAPREKGRTGLHIMSIAIGTGCVGIVAATDGAIVAAFIAGGFTLINTGLTVALTRPQRRRRRRRDERERDDQ